MSYFADRLRKNRISPAVEEAGTSVLPLSDRFIRFVIYITITLAIFEGPIRYLLSNLHLDPIIFIRDALLLAAPIVFFVTKNKKESTSLFLKLIGILFVFHAFISAINIGSVIPAIYGMKMFVPVLCGFLAPSVIFRPSPTFFRFIIFCWIATAVGAGLDQFILNYPWVGMNVELGGIDVSLGRDWNSATERVGGLMRSSIGLAIGMPLLTFILLINTKNQFLRIFICVTTLAVLTWTTQKGAILGFLLAAIGFFCSRKDFSFPIKLGAVFSTVFMVFAPTVLIFYEMPRDNGIFSFQSFIERIDSMWPAAWDWINQFPPVLGVGLGGIGGGMRFFAPSDFNPADNLFVYLYGNFGIFALIYLTAIAYLAINAQIKEERQDITALASIVFLLMYGLVISLVEDQLAALWMGATIGWLVRCQPVGRGRFLDFSSKIPPGFRRR